jgi:hypothetical protein
MRGRETSHCRHDGLEAVAMFPILLPNRRGGPRTARVEQGRAVCIVGTGGHRSE